MTKPWHIDDYAERPALGFLQCWQKIMHNHFVYYQRQCERSGIYKTLVLLIKGRNSFDHHFRAGWSMNSNTATSPVRCDTKPWCVFPSTIE